MTQDDATFALYQGRLNSVSLAATEGAPSLDTAKLGAVQARGFKVAAHQLDAVLMRMPPKTRGADVFKAVQASEWATGHQLDWAGSGVMLVIVRAPKVARDRTPFMDQLLEAFASEG